MFIIFHSYITLVTLYSYIVLHSIFFRSFINRTILACLHDVLHDVLLHDRLSSPISHHCVWSGITGDNLTPEKGENIYGSPME